MGYYINPPEGTKEDFLKTLGRTITLSEAELLAVNVAEAHEAPVCLVNNGAFTAAGIMNCYSEYVAFSRPDDHRSKAWYAVDKRYLEPFCKNYY